MSAGHDTESKAVSAGHRPADKRQVIVPSPKISRNGTLINDVIPLSAKPTIF